jgi:hypothetical protein
MTSKTTLIVQGPCLIGSKGSVYQSNTHFKTLAKFAMYTLPFWQIANQQLMKDLVWNIFNGKEILGGTLFGVVGFRKKGYWESLLITSAITTDWLGVAREVGISRKVWGWGVAEGFGGPIEKQ